MYASVLSAALLCLPLLVQGQDSKPASLPEVGKPAPAFRVNNQEGHLVAVGGASKTWTVLAFYPKAGTPG